MSLFIASLNSGSNGNCYYIGNANEAVLVDAGISCRETEKRMKRLGLPIAKVKAIFISHEHTDHISGLSQLAHKYGLPVYITPHTLRQSRMRMDPRLVVSLQAHLAIAVGSLVVTAFPKLHDACDPHSFIISDEEVTVGVFTDIGTPCEQLVRHFSRCHAAFLEANYDEQMLHGGRYPLFLKRRISGGKGHLSNRQALDLFTSHRPGFMSHILLSHLSKDNNSPELAEALFRQQSGGTEIVVASRYNESAVYHIDGRQVMPVMPVPAQRPSLQTQLSLF